MVSRSSFVALSAFILAFATQRCQAVVRCTLQGNVNRAWFDTFWTSPYHEDDFPLDFDSEGYAIQTVNSTQIFSFIGCSNDYQQIPKVTQTLAGGFSEQGFYKIAVGNVTPSALTSDHDCLTVNLHGIPGFEKNALIKQPCDFKEGPGQEMQTFNKPTSDDEITSADARFVGLRTLIRSSGASQGYGTTFNASAAGPNRAFYFSTDTTSNIQGIVIGIPNYCRNPDDDCYYCDCA